MNSRIPRSEGVSCCHMDTDGGGGSDSSMATKEGRDPLIPHIQCQSSQSCTPSISMLTKHFLSMRPLSVIFKDVINIHSNGDASAQDTILKLTVDHPIAKEFPPSRTYLINFLKFLINNVTEVSDMVYERFSPLMAQPDSQTNCFRTYVLPCDCCVTIRENVVTLSGGTTGLVSWPAGFSLTEWLSARLHLTDGKRILELGCGAGLSGIITCMTSLPAGYTFTDASVNVLDNLRENIRINCLNSKSSDCKQNHQLQKDYIRVQPLDWSLSNCDQAVDRDVYDIIVAADVTFDPESLPGLVNLLHYLLSTSNSANPSRCAYISCTIRNPTTHTLFTQLLDNAGLITVYENIDRPELFYYDRNQQFAVLNIKMSFPFK